METSRRAFLKGATAAAGLAALGVRGIEALAQDTRDKPGPETNTEHVPTEVAYELDGVEISEISDKDFIKLKNAVSGINRKYPQLIQMVKIVPGHPNRDGGSAAAGKLNGKRAVRIDTDFIGKDAPTVTDVMTHEAGHLVHNLIFHGHEFGSDDYTLAQKKFPIWQNFFHLLTLEPSSVEYKNLHDALVHSRYLAKRTAGESTSYTFLPNASEMFAMVFAVRELYRREFDTSALGMTEDEKGLAIEIMNFFPSPEQVAELIKKSEQR